MITFEQMVRRLAKDGKDILSTLTDEKVHAWHMSSCIMGEVGELIAGIHATDTLNEIEELGDIQFYFAGYLDGMKIERKYVIGALDSIIDDLSHPDELVGFLDRKSICVDHMMIAACDLFDATKKWLIYEKALDGEKVLHAAARLEFYLDQYTTLIGATREDVIAANMKKLAVRYGPDYGYSNVAAQVRADKGEVQEPLRDTPHGLSGHTYGDHRDGYGGDKHSN